MSWRRAIEHGRAVVHISSVGVSALVRPEGSTVRVSEHFVRETLVADLPLRSDLTLATRLGAWPEIILALLGLLGAETARVLAAALPVRSVSLAHDAQHRPKINGGHATEGTGSDTSVPVEDKGGGHRAGRDVAEDEGDSAVLVEQARVGHVVLSLECLRRGTLVSHIDAQEPDPPDAARVSPI